MPVTQATLTQGSDPTDKSASQSYTTASITPSADQLVVAVVVKAQSGAGSAPTLSGNGLTWVLIDSGVSSTYGVRCDVYRAMGSAPSSGAVTITVGESTQSAVWAIYEFDGVDTSGTNGSGAVRNNANNNGTGTSITITMGAFDSADNGAFSAVGRNINANGTDPDTGWTELHDVGVLSSDRDLHTMWRDDNDTSAVHTDDGVSGSSAWAGAAFEIVAAGPQNLPGVHYGVRIK